MLIEERKTSSNSVNCIDIINLHYGFEEVFLEFFPVLNDCVYSIYK